MHLEFRDAQLARKPSLHSETGTQIPAARRTARAPQSVLQEPDSSCAQSNFHAHHI